MQDTFAWPNILESLARSRDAEVNPLHMAFPFLGYRSVRDEGHDPIVPGCIKTYSVPTHDNPFAHLKLYQPEETASRQAEGNNPSGIISKNNQTEPHAGPSQQCEVDSMESKSVSTASAASKRRARRKSKRLSVSSALSLGQTSDESVSKQEDTFDTMLRASVERLRKARMAGDEACDSTCPASRRLSRQERKEQMNGAIRELIEAQNDAWDLLKLVQSSASGLALLKGTAYKDTTTGLTVATGSRPDLEPGNEHSQDTHENAFADEIMRADAKLSKCW